MLLHRSISTYLTKNKENKERDTKHNSSCSDQKTPIWIQPMIQNWNALCCCSGLGINGTFTFLYCTVSCVWFKTRCERLVT